MFLETYRLYYFQVLSSLLACNYNLNLCVSVVSVIISHLSFLMLYLSLLSFFPGKSSQWFVYLFIFTQKFYSFVDLFYYFLNLYSIYSHFDHCYFLPSVSFGLSLLFCFQFLQVVQLGCLHLTISRMFSVVLTGLGREKDVTCIQLVQARDGLNILHSQDASHTHPQHILPPVHRYKNE